jgi:hypothetical protein
MVVPAANPDPEEEQDSQRIISPFAHTTATVQAARGGRSSNWALWALVSLLVILLVGGGAFLTYRYVQDPYRTLPAFSMDKYLSDYRSMAGLKFKADLKVANDLGYQPDVGRLMVFTLENDSRPLVVLIPPNLSSIYFTKGQNYQASLEVRDRGVVYADSCEKE